MSNDAIVLLKDDHQEIRKAFTAFEQAGDGALKEKQRLVDRIIELLTVHTYIENEVMEGALRPSSCPRSRTTSSSPSRSTTSPTSWSWSWPR